MRSIDWSIVDQDDWFTTQNMMFTYSEEEQLENRIAKNNSQLVLKPKFIPLYTELLWNWYSIMEALLLWFLDFFLSNNERFYCTNDQIAELFNCSEPTISNAIKSLEKRWDIKISKKMRAWWGTIRFITLADSKNLSLQNQKIWFSKIKKVDWIYNNIIYNNISKDILLNEEINKEWEILDNIANTEIKEVKQYGKPEINDLIWAIKEECDRLWVAYVKKKERNFSQLILTSKDYWELCDKLWMSRTEFAVNILRASVAIWYFKWACSWPMRIYENYAEVYNLTKQKSDKNKQIEQNFTSLY